jgi:SAM-dependent methyltransferase
VADLTDAPHIPSESFDCIIFTQTLQMIWDMKAALTTLHRILKPGGALLLTTSGISKIGRRLGRDDWGEYWRLTAPGLERLAVETFPGADIAIAPYGNVLSACAYLQGLAQEELDQAELDFSDPDFEVIIGARIVKGGI